MFVVGLTGGIGSGKTAASDYLASQGITVVDADLASRIIVEPGQPALTAIGERFGAGVIAADGSLDRRALREIVFADAAERQALEAITHPAIGEEIRRQIAASTSPYTLLVSPLLLETSQHQLAHRVLLIDAPEALQLARTTARDRVARKQVEAIIAAQMPRQTKIERADDVLLNDGLLTHLHQKLEALHQRYLALAAEHSASGG
ncbi:dephospho-CoA kinase [Alcanivorax sp. S71-1-4]|jgi:dephospho-CoA kinase|uniref:dephospho-CoA kinase n=1 Tax=Alcanivorax sp. S71-1-4 TaxID=1177159 RepID=UPI001359B5D2|nr:dephospho-CoA kinase [Alcanivorax sp. S71-1-4]KAF0808943.1 dephospho-CoA kinase [Alcanivorax sp. S71-1-4]